MKEMWKRLQWVKWMGKMKNILNYYCSVWLSILFWKVQSICYFKIILDLICSFLPWHYLFYILREYREWPFVIRTCWACSISWGFKLFIVVGHAVWEISLCEVREVNVSAWTECGLSPGYTMETWGGFLNRLISGLFFP